MEGKGPPAEPLPPPCAYGIESRAYGRWDPTKLEPAEPESEPEPEPEPRAVPVAVHAYWKAQLLPLLKNHLCSAGGN